MKHEMNDRERQLKEINLMLNSLDALVNNGVLTRKELTDIVLRRHILAMKQVMKYAGRNLS